MSTETLEGQLRVKIHRRGDLAGESALPPTADKFLQRRERAKSARNRRYWSTLLEELLQNGL